MKCIVHYEQFDKETKLLVANERSFANLAEAKHVREGVKGENHHEDQCNLLPDIFCEDLQYHMCCYKKFTNIYHLERKFNKVNSPPRKSARLASNTNETQRMEEKTETERRGMFPDYCMICRKKVIKVNGKKQYPQLVLTTTAENSIQKAAKIRDDLEMLRIVEEEKLIAKEFKRHEKCHKDYTRVISKASELPSSTIYEKGDFCSVCERIDFDVIENRKCISMDTLLEIYGIGMDYKSRYIQLLKGRISKTYGDRLLFLKSDYHSFEIVICKENLASNPALEVFSQEYYVEKAARLLNKLCNDVISSALDLPWPPTVESLKERDEQIPYLLKLFFSTMMESRSDKSSSNIVKRLTNSFCSDILFSISRGKFLTSKHASVGLGLHSMTGMKKPVQLLHRLGHSASYEQLLRIETAQAELVQRFQDSSRQLPYKPQNNDCKVIY